MSSVYRYYQKITCRLEIVSISEDAKHNVNENSKHNANGNATHNSKNDDYVCELCRQPIPKIKTTMRMYFGLLDGCSNVFCLTCIRDYRRNWQIRDDGSSILLRNCLLYAPPSAPCPVCKAPFQYIMASSRFIVDPEEKSKFQEAFIKNTSSIRCSYMKRGLGGNVCDMSCVKANAKALAKKDTAYELLKKL